MTRNKQNYVDGSQCSIIQQQHSFNGLFSRTTWISRYHKDKPFRNSLKQARDDGVAVASAGPYAIHLHLTPDRLPHQYLITQLLRARCFSYCPTSSLKALKAQAIKARGLGSTIQYREIVRLVGRLTSHFSTKVGYIGDKILGGDIFPPTIQ